MAGVVVPTAKPLMLCEEIDEEGGMLNVYGLFNALNTEAFPYTRDSFCVFVQLSGGLGEVPCHFDIRRASDDQLIHVSPLRAVRFSRRTQLIQLATTFEGIRFPTAGVYLLELFCDNTWVADVAVDVTEYEP